MNCKASKLIASLVVMCSGLAASGQIDGPQLLFLVYRGGHAGYIDQAGRIVIAPQFRSANEFHEGRTCAVPSQADGWKYALIDTQGHLIGAQQFSACGAFSDGLGAVAFDTEKTRRSCMDCDPFYSWGYVDQSGMLAIKPQFHRAGQFSEGLAAVENDKGKWGFVDKGGNTAIGFYYDYAEGFSDGLALVSVHERFGYIDHDGTLTISPRFTYARSFSEGLALVRTSGKFVAPGEMDAGTESDGRSSNFEYIEKTARVKIRLKAEHASRFSEGLAEFGVVKKDGYLYCGYMEQTGKVVIEPKFGGCDDFSEGRASVLLEGKWHFIDNTGGFVMDPPYAQVRPFHDGLAWVSQGDSPSTAVGFGYIDKSGKLVWPPQP